MEFSDLIKDCLDEHLSIRPEVCKTTEGRSLRISIYWDDDWLNCADLDLTLTNLGA